MSGHGHSHEVDPIKNRTRPLLVFAVTVLVMGAEIVGTVLSGSRALLADARHMFTDATGLLIALITERLALRPATMKRTRGFKRAEILAAARRQPPAGSRGVRRQRGDPAADRPPEVGSPLML